MHFFWLVRGFCEGKGVLAGLDRCRYCREKDGEGNAGWTWLLYLHMHCLIEKVGYHSIYVSWTNKAEKVDLI